MVDATQLKNEKQHGSLDPENPDSALLKSYLGIKN